MIEVENAFEEMQHRKVGLQQELSELKTQVGRMASGEDTNNQVKSQLQTEVGWLKNFCLVF